MAFHKNSHVPNFSNLMDTVDFDSFKLRKTKTNLTNLKLSKSMMWRRFNESEAQCIGCVSKLTAILKTSFRRLLQQIIDWKIL